MALKEEIAQGENVALEFKEARPKDSLKHHKEFDEMEPKDVLNLLGAAPKLRSLVMRWARMAARGERLPATFSAAELGYDEQQSLERFLHVTTSRTRNGRVSGTVPEEMRDPADDERSVLAEAGIGENPYTSSVVVSAPFTFRLKDGTYFDYPMKFFMKRLVCQLPLEIVREIDSDSIGWEGYDNLVTTCENAAPIARYVQDRSPVVYTEGYPNLAVQGLLKAFARRGLKSVHMGDADLDGFRIAATVDRCIPVEHVGAAEVLADPNGLKGIPLTPAQTMRIDRFLAQHPDFKYADSVRLIRERGCWYEQEGFRR